MINNEELTTIKKSLNFTIERIKSDLDGGLLSKSQQSHFEAELREFEGALVSVNEEIDYRAECEKIEHQKWLASWKESNENQIGRAFTIGFIDNNQP